MLGTVLFQIPFNVQNKNGEVIVVVDSFAYVQELYVQNSLLYTVILPEESNEPLVVRYDRFDDVAFRSTIQEMNDEMSNWDLSLQYKANLDSYVYYPINSFSDVSRVPGANSSWKSIVTSELNRKFTYAWGYCDTRLILNDDKSYYVYETTSGTIFHYSDEESISVFLPNCRVGEGRYHYSILESIFETAEDIPLKYEIVRMRKAKAHFGLVKTKDKTSRFTSRDLSNPVCLI